MILRNKYVYSKVSEEWKKIIEVVVGVLELIILGFVFIEIILF